MNNHDGQAVDAVAFANQLDRSSEFDIPAAGLLTVHTKNSIYQFDLAAKVGLGGVLGPDWTPSWPVGATFGGSMIMMGRVLEGAHLEFVGNNTTYTTSLVQRIAYRKPEDM